LSNDGISDKFEKIQSEIERAVTPSITVKISLPEETDKEEFLKLEKDEEFLKALKNFAKRWMKRKKRELQKTKV